RFRETLARDRDAGHVPDWMVGWLYKDQTSWIDFDDYQGPGQLLDLLRWSSWKPPTCYLDTPDFHRYVDASIAFDAALLARQGLQAEPAALRDTAVLNAMDYLFCNSYPMPPDRRATRVLDFGAGHGRQYNLWSQFGGLDQYLAMDA